MGLPPVVHLIMLRERQTQYPFSGAENHLLCLLPAQRKAGLRVELVILLRSEGRVLRETIAQLRRENIEVNCFPYQPLADWRCLAAVRKHLLHRRDYIVHTHLDQADFIGKIAARAARCPRVVSTVHNNEPYHLRPTWFHVLRVLDRLTARYIAISEAVRRHLVELERVTGEKVDVIPYGVHPPAVTADRSALRARLGLPQDRFIVGFVGRLVEQKNLPLLIEAVAQIPDTTCVLVGSGALRRELEEHAARLGIDARFLGQQPNADGLMPAFDVLCLPSRWEGLGLVLIEAMLRLVPVVGSSAGAIPEVLGNGQYGWVCESGNVKSLATALKAARVNGRTVAERAYKHAIEFYTVDRMVERTLGVYARVAAQCPAAALSKVAKTP